MTNKPEFKSGDKCYTIINMGLGGDVIVPDIIEKTSEGRFIAQHVTKIQGFPALAFKTEEEAKHHKKFVSGAH